VPIAEMQRPQAPPLPLPPKREAPTRNLAAEVTGPSKLMHWLGALTVVILAAAAYVVAQGNYYTPRSNVGFYLGVVGSVMMVIMLGYPLRKRIQFMQGWGALKHWFRIHMILGIVGPTLVLFHSTFHIRSANAAVALFSMLIVVISGVIGRFVYTEIHYGLYGRRVSLKKLQTAFSSQADAAKSRLHFAPRVERWLQSFELQAASTDRSFAMSAWHLLAIRSKRAIIQIRCARELRKLLRSEPHPEFRGGASEAIHLASRYLHEVERVAYFSTYERLFSWWHILHIPLIYLLAASTIFHVISVYMY
jgi:hypothetical protein